MYDVLGTLRIRLPRYLRYQVGRSSDHRSVISYIVGTYPSPRYEWGSQLLIIIQRRRLHDRFCPSASFLGFNFSELSFLVPFSYVHFLTRMKYISFR